MPCPAVVNGDAAQAEWVELRREGGPFLHGKDAALMAYAAGMVNWARNSLYSGVTGEPLQPLQGGHARCTASQSKSGCGLFCAVL